MHAVRPAAISTPFRLPIRVYWEDTDAGGVVFYANYLKFFERARTEWLRCFGFEQQRLREQSGAIFVVSEARIKYHKPARLDDALIITVVLKEPGRASWQFSQQAFHDETLLCEADLRVGCVDPLTFRPRRIPCEITERLT